MTDRKKCPYCGNMLHANAQFCIYCMHSLEPKTDVTPPIPGRKPFLLWLVVLMFVLLLIVLMILGRTWISLASDEGHADRMEPSVHSENPDGFLDVTEEAVTTDDLDIDEPTFTEGMITEDEQRQPDIFEEETQPSENPPTETAPVICNHYYQAATCLTPMTCTICGAQKGENDENAHQWVAELATVYHQEVGHYEDVTDYVEKTKYLCFFCGYNQAGFDSMDAVREHITVHSASSNYDMIVSYPDMLTETREVWEEITVKTWIVDQEAYEETIIEGYSCSVCGKTKDA